MILRDPVESWAWLSTAETSSSAPLSTQDSACSWGVADPGGSPPGLPGLVGDKTSCFPRADSTLSTLFHHPTDPPSSLGRLLLSPSLCYYCDNYASHGEGDCPSRKCWVELGWDGSGSDSSFPAPAYWALGKPWMVLAHIPGQVHTHCHTGTCDTPRGPGPSKGSAMLPKSSVSCGRVGATWGASGEKPRTQSLLGTLPRGPGQAELVAWLSVTPLGSAGTALGGGG